MKLPPSHSWYSRAGCAITMCAVVVAPPAVGVSVPLEGSASQPPLHCVEVPRTTIGLGRS